MANKPITKPVLVLVEGLDYLHLLLRSPLVADLAFQQNVLLMDFKVAGQTLGQYLGLIRKQRNFQMVSKLGIICDAESDATAMTNSVRDHLRNTGFAVPSASKVIQKGNPETAFLIMPDEEISGCLEHSCIAACTKPDVCKCAEAFVNCVGTDGHNSNWIAKALVHATIAGSGNNPAQTLGESGQSGLWDFGHPKLAAMIQFVRRLC